MHCAGLVSIKGKNLKPKEYFGQEALINMTKYQYSATAVKKTILLAISAEGFASSYFSPVCLLLVQELDTDQTNLAVENINVFSKANKNDSIYEDSITSTGSGRRRSITRKSSKFNLTRTDYHYIDYFRASP